VCAGGHGDPVAPGVTLYNVVVLHKFIHGIPRYFSATHAATHFTMVREFSLLFSLSGRDRKEGRTGGGGRGRERAQCDCFVGPVMHHCP
jgi:hypothetical protein